MHDPVLKYGIHAGKRVSELPRDYVMWWADRPEALAENHVARAICKRAMEIAPVGDFEPGRGMMKNNGLMYDPQEGNEWGDEWFWKE